MTWVLQIVLFLSLFFTASSKEYTLTAQMVGRWTREISAEFSFTVIGNYDETYGHTCTATGGDIGPCSFQDDTDIGHLKGLSFRNYGDKYWVFTSVEVAVDGIVKGVWEGFRGVSRFGTSFIGFRVPDGRVLNGLSELPLPDKGLKGRMRTVGVTHETGTGRWHGGIDEDIRFILIGLNGKTAEHVCPANRDRGAIGSCYFEDDAKIGRLKGLRIINTGDNFWVLTSVLVEVNGVERGTWDGYRGIGKFGVAFIGFLRQDAFLLDDLIAFPGPIQDFPGPCTAGEYESGFGCEQCEENTYSDDAAYFCTSCPEGTFSAAGSTSEDDCEYEQYPTCDCWTPECGYCSNMECSVKQNLGNSVNGIGIEVPIRSELKRKTYNSVVLFDGDGNELGKFQLNVMRLYLTGCIQCRTPPELRRAIVKRGFTSWLLSIKDSVVEVKIGGQSLYRQELIGECAEVYGKVQRFAFYNVGCSNTFSFVPHEMELGEKMGAECSRPCS